MNKRKIAITVDVEDWFQVENLRNVFPLSSWKQHLVRFKEPLNRLLDLFDKHKIECTFFVLGWIAERYPETVLEIYRRGHEIASHGMTHRMNTAQTYYEMKVELIASKKLLEGLIEDQVVGYRAPSFSVTDELIRCLQETGYRYDSSYFPFHAHNRYGSVSPSLLRSTEQNGFREFPIPMGSFMGKPLPFAGGAYFRVLPLWFLRRMFARLNNSRVAVMYFHPWEFDHSQPVVKSRLSLSGFRQYFGIRKNLSKLEKFITFLKEEGCVFVRLRDELSFDNETGEFLSESLAYE